ncbi:hypothetical protein [Devriesea agamarum]|uniref:hypothetical protein n=1 Tax=Devriesea agamarum TaxID=472569 RepID=UPI00071E3C38|nr:hypothetical protein [Devriesea agamarum]
MNIVIGILVILHLVCWAVALGAWAVAARTKQISPAVAHAAAGALVFGALAMVVNMSMGAASGHLFYTIKLVVALIVTAFAFVAKDRREKTNPVVWYGIPVLIIANIVVAVFHIGG